MRMAHSVVSSAALLSAILLAGCAGGSFNQGKDLLGDDTGPDDGGGGGVGGGGNGGGDGGNGGGDGGGNGGGDNGGGDGGGDVCKTDYHPIHQTGWSKTFAITWKGATGSGSESAVGAVSLPGGAQGYQYRESLSTPGMAWDVVVTVGCNSVPGDEGMYILNYEGDFTMNVFDILPIPGTLSATLNPHRKYLPPEYAVGGVGAWSYSYTSTIAAALDSGGPQNGDISAQGSYTEAGIANLVLQTGETVPAYKLINEFTTTTTLLGAPVPASGYIEQWWVRGLGLVKETAYDYADTSVPLMTRDLTAYSGLSIID